MHASFLLCTAVLTAHEGFAQARVRAVPPPQRIRVGLINPGDEVSKKGLDEGPAPQMPVSLNIDRYLRKASSLLDRDKFSTAFGVLQDVVEGRTLTDEAVDDENPETVKEPEESNPLNRKPVEPATDDWELSSAQHAVFSEDERLFRPVRRLCHEMLASLPKAGISVYRTEHEVTAAEALEAASSAHDVSALEDVYGRYFVTLSAGRALALAGDLRMDRGAFRAALSNYRLLLATYPLDLRDEAGIDDTFVRIKIALCLAKLGASDAVRSELESLATDDPDRTLRLLGELVSVADLRDHAIFKVTEASAKKDLSADQSRPTFAASAELVPLWEHRFAQAKPYRRLRDKSKNRSSQQVFIGMGGGNGQGQSPGTVLSPERYAPGTSATLIGDRVVFLDHFRLRSHEALSGRMMTETVGPLTEKIRNDSLRARGAAIDYACGRILDDGQRLITVLGAGKRARGAQRLTDNRIVAFDRDSLEQLWTTEDEATLSGLTYLAAPTLDGDKLLVPAMREGTFALYAIDAVSGKPVYDVTLHRGGTQLARPVASPVVVAQGLAYVCMNAGALSAIDVHTGTLRWTRRYERLHPIRPKRSGLDTGRKTVNNNPWGRAIQTEMKRTPGFAPGDFFVVDGLIILAPSDGGVLHCIDGATGQPVWMLKRLQRVPGQTHISRMTYIVGHDGTHLYVAGEHDVTCIELRSGVRRWRDTLPASAALNGTWRGRGVVTEDALLLPGSRELLVRPLVGAKPDLPWRRVRLPELSIGREPLDGPFNIGVQGIYITASYEAGVEVFGTAEALIAESERVGDPTERALLLAQSGDLVGAFAVLEAIDLDGLDADARKVVVQRTMSLSSELAIAMAAHGARKDAVAILERCRKRLTIERDILRWHLSRIEVFRTLGDTESVGTEQEALYARMEAR